ncbi:hypothetical protein ANN_22100 [Periplaneta americana]|uniref:DUF4817 domain-containing protein n=1 Tax=Periplaneta americana TaxID=6978 RepID=A0ABQ8S781_PERAM|nr:hypothetical protein ANN_22100 [Periplaneta americana]
MGRLTAVSCKANRIRKFSPNCRRETRGRRYKSLRHNHKNHQLVGAYSNVNCSSLQEETARIHQNIEKLEAGQSPPREKKKYTALDNRIARIVDRFSIILGYAIERQLGKRHEGWKSNTIAESYVLLRQELALIYTNNKSVAEIFLTVRHVFKSRAGNAALARRLYQERYPQRQCPDRKTFVRLHYRLCEYGKFNSPGLGRGRPRSATPEVQEEILEAVNMTPPISTRRVALQVNVPHTTVWRLLKEYQLYPYHLQRVQALSPADYPARVRFCQWFLQQCGANPNFPALVLFTDEAQFTRDGITNFHNQHVWSYENPRATLPSHHQVRFSLNMWAGDRLVGPHVLVNRLTGQGTQTSWKTPYLMF